MSTIGRPLIKIDWDTVIWLISHQHTQKDIADFFNCSVDTLNNACIREKGMSFSDFSSKKESLGRIKLRRLQFQIIEKGGPGAATLAIYLDKRFFGDPAAAQSPINSASSNESQKTEKKSFAEFCVDAGYPAPFPQQVEMVEFALREKDPRLLLGARGYGKTDYITVLGVAYFLYVYPELTFLIITKSRTRNTAIIKEIAEALKKNGVVLGTENASHIRLEGHIGKDHSVEVITIKSSFRGRHPKVIVMDDPVTEEDTSEAERDLVKRKYDEAYKLCSNIVIIGQPAHAFDLYSELRPTLKKLEMPWGTIPELDANLDAMRIAGVSKASIEMSYHLRVPKSGGAVFADIQYLDFFPPGESVAWIDPSDGGDTSALSIVRAYMSGVSVYGEAYKMAWYHCIDDMIPALVKYKVRRLAFEINSTGKQPIGQLQQKLAPYGIGVVGVFSTTNKESVILAAGSYSEYIHLSRESDAEYTKQVIKYEGKKTKANDDAPDSLARCLEWLKLVRGKKTGGL